MGEASYEHGPVDVALLDETIPTNLARTIAAVVGPDVVLVSSADETAFEARRLLVAARHAAVAGNVSFSRECLERLALFYRNTEPDACKENQHALLSEVPFLPQDTV